LSCIEKETALILSS